MATAFVPNIGTRRKRVASALACLVPLLCFATDWPQYRGPASDGTSPDAISMHWPTNGPTVLWRNSSLTNGFSSFAVSGGRAFTQVSKDDGTGNLLEYCVAVDANTGSNLWSRPVGIEPWDPASAGDGGAGTAPYWLGDGPRPTPSVSNGRVVVFSSGTANIPELHLLCLNATNGSVIWSNDLVAAYGASTISWDNASSPLVDNGLIFVNLHTSTNNQTLAAFRLTDGTLAWSSQNEYVTHTTPIMATIQGVRQVIFASQTGLVSLNPTNGSFLWKFTYPFFQISTSMGASPVVYSNIIYCTAAYGRGAFAIRVGLTNSTWSTTQLWYKNNSAGLPYRSIWMTPVCHQGYIYTLCGENSTYLTPPLNCIELATGNLMWSTNNFGMGGLILVNTNLLILTEDGQLVLARPNPSAYTELARFQAFHFDFATPGKCWNNPAFSNGRIYAHSTTEGIAVDVSVAAALPDLVTVGASNVTSSSAVLYGTVNPNGATATAWFQWGPTVTYGSNTLVTSDLSGNIPLNISNVLGGLAPGSPYHFRIVAANSAGTTNGADLIFTTTPPGPIITNQPRSRAAVVGGFAAFNVGVSSPPTNSYQWLFFGTNVLTGQTNSGVNITNVQETNFGQYSVLVSNSFGSVTSVVANLTHAVRPLFSTSSINLNTIFLTFTTEYGPIYVVDYKNQLTAPLWLPFTSVGGTGSPISITDSAITNSARFFRIHLQ